MAFSLIEIAEVKGLLAQGHKMQDIAAYYGVNGGRIADVKTGKNKRAIGVLPLAARDLPVLGPTGRDVRDIQTVALQEAAENLALFISFLRQAKPLDENRIDEVKRTLVKVHAAMADRAQELARARGES